MRLGRFGFTAHLLLASAACTAERAAARAEAPAPAEELAPAAPSKESPAPNAPAKTLFERLGGLPAVEAVVGDFQANVAADPTINAPFGLADLKLLNRRLVEFVCAATGGPCKYTGRDMKAAHRGMMVSNAQFDALVGALVKSLDKFHVPDREKNELLGALGPLRAEIVEVD